MLAISLNVGQSVIVGDDFELQLVAKNYHDCSLQLLKPHSLFATLSLHAELHIGPVRVIVTRLAGIGQQVRLGIDAPRSMRISRSHDNEPDDEPDPPSVPMRRAA